MSYYYRQVQFGPGSPPPVVKKLLIANVAVFLAQSLLWRFIGGGDWLVMHFGMTPALFLKKLHLWQPFTYMFLHGGLFHVFLNMVYLWMFGTEVEQKMGSRQFWRFYIFCGVGAGIMSYLLSTAVAYITHDPMAGMVPTIGASGAIFGVMLAFGLFFPNRIILLFLVVPVRAYYLVIGLGLLNLYSLVFVQGQISYIAHVGGMLCGYLFLKYYGEIIGTIEEYAERGAQEKRRKRIMREKEEQKRVDEILDKINRDGMHKLTREERNILRDRSKRRRK